MRTLVAALALALAASPSLAAVTAVDLANYRLTATYALPLPSASEASAVTWNWDNGNLFVLGDEGDALVEVNRSGALVSQMTLTGFDDTEGIAYAGNGRFVITEERLQDAYELTYTAGGSVARGSLPSVSLGPTIGNIGIEGIAYERATGGFLAVKEKSPQAVYQVALDFGAGGSVIPTSLFSPAALAALDLSDIAVLSNVSSLAGTADANGLLIYSQESAKLFEVGRDGAVRSTFSLAGISDSAEGVTIDADGVIYIVDETPNLYVLTPVPEPGTYALMAAGLGVVGWYARARCREHR